MQQEARGRVQAVDSVAPPGTSPAERQWEIRERLVPPPDLVCSWRTTCRTQIA